MVCGGDEDGHRKLAASDIGVNAPRGCTDILGLILFFLAWGAMGYLASVAYKMGDMERLLYGVDYLGNTCGQGTPENVRPETAAEWFNLTKLYYPITFNPVTRTFNTQSALKLGICVSECPSSGSYVLPYGATPQDDAGMPNRWGNFATRRGWLNMMATTLQLNRCIPRFATFSCPNTTQTEYNACMNNRGNAGKAFDKLMSYKSVGMAGLREMKENWWIVLVCMAICILLAFLWLFILRRLVKPVVVITTVLVFLLLAGVGYFLFLQNKLAKENATTAGNSGEEPESAKYYFYGAIAVWVLAFIYLCVVIFLFKDIMVACDIIEEASKIPVQMPTMMLVPLLIVVLVIPFVFFWLFTALHIYTSAKKITLTTPTFVPQDNSTGTAISREWSSENWRPYAQLYNVFMFLWAYGWLNAIGYMVLAMCAVFWYWSKPGDDKQTDHGVLTGLKLTLGNHLGTVALGSLIVAIIQVMRIILTAFEYRMKEAAEKSETLRFIMCCAQCCLAYLERVVKFINKNAYIVCAMTGENFIRSAKHALSLLVDNALSVGAVSIIGEYVMLFGKLFITAASTAVCYAIMTNTKKGREAVEDSRAGFFLMLAVVAVLSYFVAAVFINVFGVCIDTVLLSYCYDLEQHNGADKPYFFPDDLAKHVDRAKERAADQRKRKEDMSQPLNEVKHA